MESDRVLLEVKTSRTSQETPEAMVQFLSNLVNLRIPVMYFWRQGIPIALEIATIDQAIHFYINVPRHYQAFVEGQIISQYPKALVSEAKDYLAPIFEKEESLTMGQMRLANNGLLPIRTYKEFNDVDPMSSLLATLSKAQREDIACVQFLLIPSGSAWQKSGQATIGSKTTDASGASVPNPHAGVIAEKIAYHGFRTGIRIAVNSGTLERSKQLLNEIATSFSSFNNPKGNSFYLQKPVLFQKTELRDSIKQRASFFVPRGQMLNLMELATMFHLPNEKLSTIRNISWYRVIVSDAPENLPVAETLTEEERKEVNFFAKTEYRNKMTTFGIKSYDRRKHMYIIGKSGSGKSTLIANMAISDIRNGKGMAIIDPHGDLCYTILDYIPSYRVNDVVYLDPSDPDFAFSLNPLEVTNDAQRELIASGIVAIFKKLYADSWGPRLEYILRNTIMTLVYQPEPTLLDVMEILVNKKFRDNALQYVKDPVILSFWKNEFEKISERNLAETLSPIQNKVGQFISSTLIRNILKNPKSTVDLEKCMNEGKIVIFNLSQGKVGEDNAALLGAMTITKLQIAAMNRVNIPEHERRDFYLYVDEFQNFATTSFIKILSEARKYRLAVILANQYTAQIPEEIRSAIFGNAATVMSFLVGATDADIMGKEFSERFKPEDLLALGNYQAILKLSIDGYTQPPFHCFTLPLPRSITQTKEKVLTVSRQRYYREVVPEEATFVPTPVEAAPRRDNRDYRDHSDRPRNRDGGGQRYDRSGQQSAPRNDQYREKRQESRQENAYQEGRNENRQVSQNDNQPRFDRDNQPRGERLGNDHNRREQNRERERHQGQSQFQSRGESQKQQGTQQQEPRNQAQNQPEQKPPEPFTAKSFELHPRKPSPNQE